MNCANTLSKTTREMTLDETIQFLEPHPEIRDASGKVLVREKGPAICLTSEHFNQFKTDLEVACEMMGNKCTYEMKSAIESVSTTMSYLVMPGTERVAAMIYIPHIPKRGERSAEVKTLQIQLKAAAFDPGPIDGVFGKQVEAAVKGFQRLHKLPGSGKIGPVTLELLGLTLVRPVAPVAPVTENKSGVTRELIADTILKFIKVDIDAGLRESGGKNRGPKIDKANLRAHSYLGAPYCASMAWCAYDDACKELGLKNPIPPTASSQAFTNTEFVPAKYIRKPGMLGRKGDVGTLRSPTDSDRGHHTTLCEDQEREPLFKTYEYNTDGSGSRDGDGAYAMTRTTVDFHPRNAGKKFMTFADIPQWIYDANLA